MIPIGIFHPFMYILDIVKDCMELAFLIHAVNGLKNVCQNWSSFSSVVSIEKIVNPHDLLNEGCSLDLLLTVLGVMVIFSVNFCSIADC